MNVAPVPAAAGAVPPVAATAPVEPGARFAAALERFAPPPGPRPAPGPAAPASVPPALAAIERAQARLDGVLAAARSGRVFTAQELLGLQAEAYRTTQTVDLAAKLVEQGAQAVKQATNAQI